MGALYFSAVPPWCIMTHHSGSAVFEIILLSVYISTVYSVGGLVQSTLPSVCCALYGYIHRYGTAADNSGLKSPMNYGVRPNHRQWLGETIKRNSGPKILHSGKPVWVWYSSSTPIPPSQTQKGSVSCRHLLWVAGHCYHIWI